MKYKSIIFDLDGTVVPSKPEGMPSEEVIKAIHKLQGKIKLSFASGRSINTCRNIEKVLGLTDPCIISGGSQIVNPKTEEIIWEQHLPDKVVEKVVNISRGFSDKVAINGITIESKASISEFYKIANIIVIIEVRKDNTDSLVEELTKIPDLAVHILPSWTEGDYWDIHITHKLATKKHSIEKLIEILGVKKEEVIGIGDGNNDMPLFESVGYKIAMGNAVDVLKNAADYITDTLENNGFAKFIDIITK